MSKARFFVSPYRLNSVIIVKSVSDTRLGEPIPPEQVKHWSGGYIDQPENGDVELGLTSGSNWPQIARLPELVLIEKSQLAMILSVAVMNIPADAYDEDDPEMLAIDDAMKLVNDQFPCAVDEEDKDDGK